MRIKTRLATFVVIIAASQLLSAQTIAPDVNDESAWTVIKDDDSMVEFGWDYSELGIPPAPGGTDTLGIRMAANIVGPNPAMISASPNGISLTAPFTMTFDMWINYNTSGGTTEYAGAQIGFDPTLTGEPFNGVGLIGNSDGDDSGGDLNFYVDGVRQAITAVPSFYTIASNNNSDEPMVSTFTTGEMPDAQTMAPFDPTNVKVSIPAGALGFAWHQVTVDVTVDEAIFLIDELEIGRVPASFGVNGPVAITFADVFPSVSTKPEFSFGVFDNLSIQQVPEPSSYGLVGVALAGLLGLCRRAS